jgi:hypothetical protein
MAIPVQLFAGSTPLAASKIGQLITAPFDYDLVKAIKLDVDDQVYNFYKPIVGKAFVITGIILNANKSVTSECLVDVYAGTAADDSDTTDGVLTIEMLKNTALPLLGLNVLVGEGKWINAKTDDDDVFCTIMGYYVPASVNGSRGAEG